jgi:hypothetical protein
VERVVVGSLLILHGLVHLGYASPRPNDPRSLFAPERAWFASAFGLSAPAAEAVAKALAAITAVMLTISGIALFADADLWKPTAVIGAAVSCVLLVLTFHPWLTLGVAIDLFIIASVLWIHWPAALFAL